MAKRDNVKEEEFLALADTYKEVVAKVCYMYTTPQAAFDDLYQEVMINLWQGMGSFRGESKMSTWIYRTALNTCISWHRSNRKHGNNISLDSIPFDTPESDNASQRLEEYSQLKMLIDTLNPLDKALITLWLDEKPYSEIAVIMGISQQNVGIRVHRIKEKLQKLASQ